MSVINAVPLLAAAGGDYQISRSVRMRSSASAYFNRTTGTATSTTTWTWSGWVKRGSLGTQVLFSGGTAANNNAVIAFSSDVLDVYNYVSSVVKARKTTTQVFRDVSAWYHIVVAASGSSSLNVYVNGAQVTAFSASTTPDGSAWLFQSGAIKIGADAYAASNFFDGYLTEINFVDGQALTPSSFGENDAITGVWKPKAYKGTYGTNGFYLNFSDNSAATAAAIGKDSSGNGNNWTPNNISVTAGVTYDSMLDVPTPYADGGNGRGNYAVLNPIGSHSSMTIVGGNLNVTSSVGSQGFNAYSSVAVSTGKWYVEATVNTGADADMIGVCPSTLYSGSARFDGLAGGVGYYMDGRKFVAGTASAYGASYTTGNVIGIALDMDAQTVTFYKDGTSQGTISSSLTAGVPYYFVTGDASAGTGINQSWNFGQRPFSYTPPTGFKALNTQNLPDSTITKGSKYFDATAYSGNSSTNAVTNSGSMQPDLVWIKSRSSALAHYLTDSVRGAYKVLFSSLTNAEYDGTSFSDGVSSFNSNGFTLLNGSNVGNYNQTGSTYAAWQWKKGATQGFDIVTYTGSAGAQNISHSLGVAPAMIITKVRNNAGGNFGVYHKSIGNTGAVFLNTTNATATSSLYWNNTSPTSSVFSVGSNNTDTNWSTYNFVAYLFAEVAGFSKFGSYTGNASTDGPFVYCGFRPRYLLWKRSDGVADWGVFDTARDPYNGAQLYLGPNLSAAESNIGMRIDLVANGFKIRTTGDPNASGGTYIYAAFAENPFKNSLAR